MKTKVYCDVSDICKQLLVPHTQNIDEASVAVYMWNEEMPSRVIMEVISVCGREDVEVHVVTNESCCYWLNQVLPTDYIRLPIIHMTISEVCENINDRYVKVPDVSIPDFVKESNRLLNAGLDEETLLHLTAAFEKSLLSHSMLTCIVALRELLTHSKVKNSITYRELIPYVVSIYRKVTLAESTFEITHSQYLSILAAERKVGVTSEYVEDYARYIMFKPICEDVNVILNRTKEVTNYYKNGS